MRKPKFILKIIFLIIYCSCTTPTETKYDTATLNLKGNIKHLTERKTNSFRTLEIEFEDNRVISIKTENPISEYAFEYEEQKLNHINHRGNHIKPEDFPLSFELLQPLYTYNPDSMVRNMYQDPIQIISIGNDTNTFETYRVEYTYDQFNNWVVRELYYGNNNVVIERTERTILYAREVTNKEIITWNEQLDSIYKQCKIRSALGTLIDTTIYKDKQRLKQIDTYSGKYYNDAVSMDTTVEKMLDKFNKTYGQDYLSPDLKRIKKKLNIVLHLALDEKYLYKEVNLIIPLLASGKKSVKNTVEPFETRHTLTYTLDLIADIQRKEMMYVSELD
jgi:hypothetical protein